MSSRLRLAVLALLLLFMQGQALVHPIVHLPGAPAHETGLTATHAVEACVECALLAGGVAALLPGTPPAAHGAPAHPLVFVSHRSRAADVPAWFQSRAPPVLL